MTEPTQQGLSDDGADQAGPIIRDKRRIDPDTGHARAHSAAYASAEAGVEVDNDAAQCTETVDVDAEAAPTADSALAQERLADLQRLSAEYANYRKRVDRERETLQIFALQGVMESLLPVLDDIALARDHGDLSDGPFAAIAEKLEATLGKFGLERFGQAGDAFDPTRHEALMHSTSAEASSESIQMVMQPGYSLADKVIRPARVGVVSPE